MFALLGISGLVRRVEDSCELVVSSLGEYAWAECMGGCDIGDCNLQSVVNGTVTAYFCMCGNYLPSTRCLGALYEDAENDPPTYTIYCATVSCPWPYGPCFNHEDEIFDPPGGGGVACTCP